MPEEKGTLNGEINDLQDGLKVKERKVNDLQKRMENLQEQLRDKEKQMGSLTERVNSLQVHTSNTDTALTTLEESLAEMERTIQWLKAAGGYSQFLQVYSNKGTSEGHLPIGNLKRPKSCYKPQPIPICLIKQRVESASAESC